MRIGTTVTRTRAFCQTLCAGDPLDRCWTETGTIVGKDARWLYVQWSDDPDVLPIDPSAVVAIEKAGQDGQDAKGWNGWEARTAEGLFGSYLRKRQ